MKPRAVTDPLSAWLIPY